MADEEFLPLSWKDLASAYPEFVTWIVQRYGGVPEGKVKESDYNKYVAAYQENQRGG